MATQEKLLKSLESLRNLISSNLTTDISIRRKEKIQHCNIITDAMSNSTIRIAQNFGQLLGFTIEVLLQLCDDPEADVRMIADECLNRVIRAMVNGNISKVQIELHKELRKNGASRSLRTALSKFSQLAHFIRPHKGKPYIANIVPCIVKISERPEEMVHETLASNLPKIMNSLGCFTSDNDVKALLKTFLGNVLNPSSVIRRSAAACILTTCLNSKKSYVFITFALNSVIDMLVPIQETHNNSLISGVMNCLKLLLPHLKNSEYEQEIQGSFGVRKEVNENPSAVDKLLQVYELCLHYISHSDHNLVNAALETLNTLLQNCPLELKSVLLSSNGITKSRIFLCNYGVKLKQRSPSQISVATTLTAGDENLLENDLLDGPRLDIEKWIDESKLSVYNITYVKTAELGRTQQSFENLDSDKSSFENIESDYSNITMGTISDHFTESMKSESVIDNLDKLVLSENSSDKSFGQNFDDRNSTIDGSDVFFKEVPIGDFCDNDVPLVYCSRLVIKSFLLTGLPRTLVPDKLVRVSVKSLALACLSTIIQLHPPIFLKYLEKCDDCANNEKQQISDILLFDNHSDPQLRGAIRILISSFLKTVLISSGGDYKDWISRNKLINDVSIFDLPKLVGIIVKGLEDESSNCSRQSLVSLQICMKYLMASQESRAILPILEVLPLVSKNPYWLVKVKLLEVIAEINYIIIHHIISNCQFQDKVIYNILFELLKDEDQRVRSACSGAFVKVVPLLYFKQDSQSETTVTTEAKNCTDLYFANLFNPEIETSIHKKHFTQNMPFPFNDLGRKCSENVERSLSRLISQLTNILLTTTSKHFIFGCIETLFLLTETYPTTVYSKAWGCFKNYTAVQMQRRNSQTTATPPNQAVTISSAASLLNICISFLTNGTAGYDINCHSNLLKLSGNLFAGISIKNLKPITELNLEETTQQWDMFTDQNLAITSEKFFNHTIKLLNIFYHVIDEVIPSLPQSKPILPNLPNPPVLSPIKRRKSDVNDKSKILSPLKTADKDDKADRKSDILKITSMGYFVNISHYMKLYEILKTSYTNYKTSLESGVSEIFLELLKSALGTLSQLLELGTIVESGRIADEVLHYFRTSFTLEPCATVECVQQLLKCLFGTNFTFNSAEFSSCDREDEKENEQGFYFNMFQVPYNDISLCLNTLNNNSRVDCDSDHTVMGYLHRKENKKLTLPRGADKILANYIRLFEPMVIKSLKQYTVTSDVKLQCKVLQLLCQLVQLRVNYCLLDSEQIFIGFVLKQFEFIEEGQIPLSDELIPKIFHFLVQLSYSKQHSKSIIAVPKILQLCDGLMASGQPPVTHCIPALEPIIEDIFLSRNKSNTTDFKELETTREVLLSMLLRLLEYHEIVDLLVIILNESKYCNDNSEKWLKWSKQITDVFLLMLKQNQIRLDTKEAFISVQKLIFVLNPNVFKPINDVLITLFQDPPYLNDPVIIFNRWLGKIIILLLVLYQTKEEILLIRIVESQEDFIPRSVFENVQVTPDPLNVTSTNDYLEGMLPEVIFVRYIFRIICLLSEKCVKIDVRENNIFLIQQFSGFLMYCLHIFQSGSHCKIANAAMYVINDEIETSTIDEKIPVDKINRNFLKLAPFFPTLTWEWCYLLTLLNYDNNKFWAEIMQITDQKNPIKFDCINLEIIRTGGTIVYCDYLSENISNNTQLSWVLSNNIQLLVSLCDEAPVAELIACVLRNASTSALIIEAINADCLENKKPNFLVKILKCIENAHISQTGALLSLLITKLLNCKQLSLSRLVANLASRKVELFLTLSKDEMNSQLSKENLKKIMDGLVEMKLVKKHETLVGLLNKLATQFYNLSPLQLNQRRTVNPDEIKRLQVDKSWYLSQIGLKCSSQNVGSELAEVLSVLDDDDLSQVTNVKNFNKSILKENILFGTYRIINEELSEEPSIIKVSFDCVLKNVINIRHQISKPHQVYGVIGRETTPSELKYSNEMSKLFNDDEFWSVFYELIPSISCCIESLPVFPNIKIPDGNFEDLLKFAVVCLESVNFIISKEESNLSINFIDKAVHCADVIFKENFLCSILALDTHISWLCSAVNSTFKLVNYLLLGNSSLPVIAKSGLGKTFENLETVSAGQACNQLSILILWLQKLNWTDSKIPKFLLKSIKSIIVSLSRLPLVNSYILTPPTAWKHGFFAELSGPFKTQVPPLPIELLQELEVLEEFIFRITLLGWTSRQQFEETWMSLLSILSFTPTEEHIPEEMNDIIHAMSLAVQTITALLLHTLCLPILGNINASKLIQVSRDPSLVQKSTSVSKLIVVQNNFENKYNEYAKRKDVDKLINVFKKQNTEKYNNAYSYNQLSVEYLLIASRIVEIIDDNSLAAKMNERRESILAETGLDVNSCLQFLLDLYSQWIKSQTVPLRLLHEIVKSILVISDLFTEKSQFSWMLEVFLELSKIHNPEDDILHQYLTVGTSKAAAILTPDLETYEAIKRLITQNLKSGFLPARISSLHGMLYMMEGCILGNTVIGGISEEMQLILPLAVDYIHCHINSGNSLLYQAQDHNLLVWALAFYILENVDEKYLDANFKTTVLQAAITQLSHPKVTSVIHNSILKSVERLIIKKCISGKIFEQVTKLSLDKLKCGNPSVSLPAMQLLLSCMYTEGSAQLEKNDTAETTNPDSLVQTIEKLSAIFEHIRRGYPFEVKILCTILPNILNDFFPPSDILTKVLGEFLSPQQPHSKLLSRVVFKVFESAIKQSQLPLLQDWVVFSLSNFTQSFSIGMATWCLTCFFVSASTNEWLRSLFPCIQARTGHYEYEDRKMFCIAGVDFYKNLTSERQRQIFKNSFEKVKNEVDTPFNDLLVSL